MNQKRAFKSDKPNPTYLHEVQVPSGSKTYTLRKGMEATLFPERGKKEKRRWEFMYAETQKGTPVRFDSEKGLVPIGETTEELMLTFYGPVRSQRQKYRRVRLGDVLTVHIKSEARP